MPRDELLPVRFLPDKDHAVTTRYSVRALKTGKRRGPSMIFGYRCCQEGGIHRAVRGGLLRSLRAVPVRGMPARSRRDPRGRFAVLVPPCKTDAIRGEFSRDPFVTSSARQKPLRRVRIPLLPIDLSESEPDPPSSFTVNSLRLH